MTRFFILPPLERRRAALERKVAYWEDRVKMEPGLQPQLDHHRAQLQRLIDRLGGSGDHD